MIATLQVGFPVFAHHHSHDQLALALLVRPEDQLASALQTVQPGRWLLADSHGAADLAMARLAIQALNGTQGHTAVRPRQPHMAGGPAATRCVPT
ncbi:hypothetical protein ULF88_10510 [Halopseudomonas pachastrellae]|nr:hypothetical protein [Halopseudomonas pachastrellae]